MSKLVDDESMLRPRNRASPEDRGVNLSATEQNSKGAIKLFDRRASSEGTVKSIVRSVSSHWSLLSFCSRVALILVISLLSIHIIIGTLDTFFHYYGLGDESRPSVSMYQASVSKQVREQHSFAVVINTYKRPEMLRDAVRHYGQTCGPNFGVHQVFIVWAEQEVTPPLPDSFFSKTSNLFRGGTSAKEAAKRASVHIIRVSKDSLNSRFEPIKDLQSDGIFMVDDDVRVSCQTLFQGFRAWAASPDAMAGYYPRLATQKEDNPIQLHYNTWRTVYWRQKLNFVLTKACFMHSKYLTVYSDPVQHPQEILDYVDKHKNCEDVAMSMLVANYTRSTLGSIAFPIYVEGSIADKGVFGGISTGGGHFATRSDCLTDLTKIYRNHGWNPPLEKSASLQEHSWVHHSPGFWWQARPSHFLEWLAFG